LPTILHADWSNRPRTAFRRWTQAVHQVAAIQVGRHRFLACPYRFLAAKRQAKADLSSGRSHDRTAFESFAPDISEQPDPNLTDLFDTRNHGSQRLSASYQHTRHVVVTRTHAHTMRDKGTKALTVVSGEVRAELPRLFLCERPSSIAPRWVKGGRQELECTQSGKESVQLPAVHHCCGANRGRIVSLQSRYSSPFINLSPFFLRNFGPERKHACSF